MWRREDVGGLRHEVHAAEDDVLRLRPGGGELSELERITGVVRVADHLVALVVMAENDQPLAQRAAGGDDPRLDVLGGGGDRKRGLRHRRPSHP